MKQQIINAILQWGRAFTLVVCGILSVLLCMSAYESYFNKQLPLVKTLDSVNLQILPVAYRMLSAAKPNVELYGDFGKPVKLRIPENSLNVSLAPPIHDDSSGSWLARSHTMHALVTHRPKNGAIDDLVLYCRASFRTLNDQSLPKVGTDIFIQTDKAQQYAYKVLNTKVAKQDGAYSPSPKTDLIIGCGDNDKNNFVIVEATLITVQRV